MHDHCSITVVGIRRSRPMVIKKIGNRHQDGSRLRPLLRLVREQSGMQERGEHHLRLVTRPEIPRRKREIVPRRRRDVGQQIEMGSYQRPGGFRAMLCHFTAEIVYLKHRFRDLDGDLIEPALSG